MAANINIRASVQGDNPGLLALTRLTPMKGVISLCIERQPDFFSLLKYRGPYKVLLLEKNNAIIGSFSASQQTLLLNSLPEKIFYLADFKIHPEYRGHSAAVRLVRAMHEYLLSQSADLLVCTAAEGNSLVLPFFEGRLGIPPWENFGKFKVLQILPSRNRSIINPDICNKGPEGFSLSEYYQTYYTKHYKLAPLIQSNDLVTMRNMVLYRNGAVVAGISLIDTSSMKQNIVVDMPLGLRAVVSVSKCMHQILGWRSLPGVGESIRMLNIRYWAHSPGHKDALLELMQYAQNVAASESYHFLSVGLHEKDPLLATFSTFKHLTFNSGGFVSSLKKHPEKIKIILEGLVFEDFSII